MTTILSFGRDTQGYNSYAPPFADDKFSVTLAAGVAQSFTVPSNYRNWTVSFSYQPGASVWVAKNATATAATGTIAATASEFIPGSRTVMAGDVISLLTNNTNADVGVCLYAAL